MFGAEGGTEHAPGLCFADHLYDFGDSAEIMMI
jgi:hypothetical protein